MDPSADSAHWEDMKADLSSLTRALALSLSLAACGAGAETPQASPSSEASPATAFVATEAVSTSFLDAPQSEGDWKYFEETQETLAFFGPEGETPSLILRCNLQTNAVGIGRPGQFDEPVPMRIRTETTTRVVMASPVESAAQLVAAELPANDPLLDAMAITKGRFAVEVENAETIYAPAWAEVTRVIEDCR